MGRVPPAWRGARARRKRTCWASSPERASAEASKRVPRASHLAQCRAGLSRGSTGWRRIDGGCSLVQCPSTVHGTSAASAARHARASEANVLGLVPRESERRGAQARYTRKPPRAVRGRAGTWKHGLVPKERRLLARAVPFQSAWSLYRQRGAARARKKRLCWASSPERASAVARKRATRASHHEQ